MNHFLPGLLVGLLGGIVATSIFLAFRMSSHRSRVQRTLRRIRAAARRRAIRLETRAQTAQRLAELGTLTGGLAHEIKNPLSTVLLNLQLLQEDLNPNEPAHGRLVARLATVTREASRLRDILDDFLRFAGKIELRKEPVDLNRLLEELIDFFAPQAQLSKVQLRFKPYKEPLTAEIDPRLIKQMILNLMINALQAMPNGGDLIVSADVTGDDAVIDVIDTGAGISADAVGKIFQAYYSTKKGGTGLGLAMAQRIVQEHGGSLSVSSELGKGSDFKVKLPSRR
jgi:signal transduction histidine kinase